MELSEPAGRVPGPPILRDRSGLERRPVPRCRLACSSPGTPPPAAPRPARTRAASGLGGGRWSPRWCSWSRAVGYGYFRYEWRRRSRRAPCSHVHRRVPSGQPLTTCCSSARTVAPARPQRRRSTSGARPLPAASAATPSRSSGSIRRQGTASSLSIPRDTFVTLSGMPGLERAGGRPTRSTRHSAGARRAHQDDPEHFRHPDQPLHRGELLRPPERGGHTRGHLHGRPLSGPRPRLLLWRLQQQLRSRHPDDRLPGPQRRTGAGPFRGRVTSNTRPTANGLQTRPEISAASSART